MAYAVIINKQMTLKGTPRLSQAVDKFRRLLKQQGIRAVETPTEYQDEAATMFTYLPEHGLPL